MKALAPVRRSILFSLATMAFWLLPALDVSADVTPPTQVSAVIIVDGVRVPALSGRIIKTGTIGAGGNCAGLDRTIEVRAPETVRFGAVELEVTGACQLKVASVTFDAAAHPGPSRPAGATTPSAGSIPASPLRASKASPLSLSFKAAALTTHEIWSDESFFEQFGLKVTETYNRFRYMEDTNSVYNETMWEAWCWHGPFGWTTDSCIWNDLSSPPSWINTNTYGAFHNECCGGIYHSLKANGWAQPGAWSYWCNFAGTAPPFWHDNCTGGRNF